MAKYSFELKKKAVIKYLSGASGIPYCQRNIVSDLIYSFKGG